MWRCSADDRLLPAYLLSSFLKVTLKYINDDLNRPGTQAFSCYVNSSSICRPIYVISVYERKVRIAKYQSKLNWLQASMIKCVMRFKKFQRTNSQMHYDVIHLDLHDTVGNPLHEYYFTQQCNVICIDTTHLSRFSQPRIA